jgi:plasmid stabilization system protein ParE
MTVRFTARAEADLLAIATYIGRRSPGGAKRVGDSIHRTIAMIEAHPLAGIGVRVGLYMRIVTDYPYKIFYRFSGTDIDIVHVRHAARRPWA